MKSFAAVADDAAGNEPFPSRPALALTSRAAALRVGALILPINSLAKADGPWPFVNAG